MIYYNYDIHLRATVRFTVIKMEMDWKNMQYLCKYRLITETAFHRYWSDCLQILENSQEKNRGGVLF